jgi:hypothetical protein
VHNVVLYRLGYCDSSFLRKGRYVCVSSFIFSDFSGNLALFGTFINLRTDEWRKLKQLSQIIL